MLGAHPIEVALGSTYDRANLKTILGAMADAGLAVFFCKTNEKEPAPHDVMPGVTYRKMEKAGVNLGHGLATFEKATLQRWLKRWTDTHDDGVYPNLAVNPGLSRLIVVDVDTQAELDAFMDHWAEAEGWTEDPNSQWPEAAITPTVLTPGDRDAQGNWKHKDGGHFYFTLPEGFEVPATGPGVVKMPGGWAIYMRDCYVLVPPSIRAEGPYVMAGKVREAPAWLLEAAGSKQRTTPPAAVDAPGLPQRDAQTINDWASQQSWDDLLADRGYRAYRPDKCGADCMTYTAPGPHANPKSLTAHGPTCSLYDQTMGHGPLHFWTDNAPEGFEGKGTYSMLQFVARADYDGSIKRALDALGLEYSPLELKTLDGPVRERRKAQPLPVLADEDAFWSARPELKTIREFAYARATSPWAVLGVVLCRVLGAVPPWVTLPSVIGGPGSLNFLLGIVGPSGAGKGAAMAAARDIYPTKLHEAPAGSGEGIAHQYAYRATGGELKRERDAVLFDVPEVDKVAAIQGRSGSTLLSSLRSAFSGEEIGFSYADPTRRIPLGRHTYRLCMVVGIQPEKAGPLLDDADGGTPQRFLWLPGTDPAIPLEPVEGPNPLVPAVIEAFTAGRGALLRKPGHTKVTIDVAPSVLATIREAHVQRNRGDGDALDGHALFVREKVAAALAVLDSRARVDVTDWELAEVVMNKSNATRGYVQDALKASARDLNEQRGRSMGLRQAVADEAAADRQVQRVGRTIVAKLREHGPMTRHGLRKAHIAGRDKGAFNDALALQIAAGHVVDTDGGELTTRP